MSESLSPKLVKPNSEEKKKINDFFGNAHNLVTLLKHN